MSTHEDDNGPTSLVQSARAVQDYAAGSRTLEDTLARLVVEMVAVLRGDVAGVTWLTGQGAASTVATTHPLALELDGAQYDTGRGPCLVAAQAGRIARVDDTSAPGEWPEFEQAAAARGIRSGISLPVVAGRNYGAFNIYGHRPMQFAGFTEEPAVALLAQAGVVGALHEARREVDNLKAAIATRSVIDQAKGVIMAARGCDADTAFQSLVHQSQRENRKLRDIAAELVAGLGERED